MAETPNAPGAPEGVPPEPIREHMRAAFQSVLDAAVPAYEIGQLKLFHDEEERYIREEVERKLYEPQLPNGGSKERRMIERLKKLDYAKTLPTELHDRIMPAIRAWEKVLPTDPRNAGRYYGRKPLRPAQDKELFKALLDHVKLAQSGKDWDRKWFAQMWLDGMPEAVSDFEMECLFVLRKSNGTVDRLVRLRNVLGEVSKGPHHKGSDILDARAFAAPERFREWCLAHGNFAWSGNQTDLQKLHEDYTHFNAQRVINQIDSVGSLTVGKTVIWFCDECAYASPVLTANAVPMKSQLLMPDEDGVYWVADGEGYYLNRKGRETQFNQGRPKMLPETSTRELLGGDPGLSERELIRDFYQEINSRLCETLGDSQGSLALGAVLAYSAAPEIFREYGLFPGLFIHGQMESGKTKLTEWLMRLRGFEVSSGIGLLKGTPVGLLCEAENYSNEPIWADEYRQGKVKEDVEAVFRDAYNRQSTVKWSPDGVQRMAKTSFVISGESTSSDSATRSRFPHIQVSSSRRKANHLVWMEANKTKFFVIGRFVHENRNEFVAHLRRYLTMWLQFPELAGVNERERMVHGIDYASWMAMLQMLESHTAEEAMTFKKFMIAHAKGSAADVTSETNIMVFLTDLLTAWKAGEIDNDCFRVESTPMEFPPGRPNQKSGRWDSYRIYIDPDPTISAISGYLAKRRAEITLRRKDLRDQLSKTPFWIEGMIRKRFGKGKGGTLAWGFELDKMGELGYQPCSDEEWEAYLLKPDLGDPRKGGFFAIIDEIEREDREARRAAM